MECVRLTRRADGLCAKHAEEERAYQEYSSDFSSQENLYEANVVGYDELNVPPSSSKRRLSVEWSTYISYRVNLLHWNFVKNELYEWKLKKRYSEFDQLRKDLIASHGKLPSKIQFPSKITVGFSKEKKCLQRCKMLTNFLKGLIAWNINSPILIEFLDIQDGRVDEMAELGKKPHKGSGDGVGHDRTLHKTQSSWGGNAKKTGNIVAAAAAAAAASHKRRVSGDIKGNGSSAGGSSSQHPPAIIKSKVYTPSGAGHVVVTLGGPLNPDASPGTWLQGRVEAGCSVFHRAVKEQMFLKDKNQVFMVVTGGDCGGFGVAEAQVAKNVMVEKYNVPSKKILAECLAKDTIQNALLVVPLLIRLGITKVSIVTSEFHVRRTKHYFETILAAYGCLFEVMYVACEDYMERTERSIRDRKETLLVARSQGLLDQSASEIHHERSGRHYGRKSWSFSFAKGSQEFRGFC